MILIDNTQILLASIFSQTKKIEDISVDVIRHVAINTYRYYSSKYKAEYGEMVICQDAGNYWRNDIFPHYKANRKKQQNEDKEHWDRIFDVLGTLRTEVAENFPYKNMRVERCEADDIIATIVKHHHDKEKILIVSSDKDFQQLHRYENVHQFSPIHKGLIRCKDPSSYLFEHILRGDTSDGVPNILSDDDTFVDDDKRQTPLSVKKINLWKSASVPTEHGKNWERNQKMVDLTYIPVEFENNIVAEYNKPIAGTKGKIFEYLVKNKMKLLLEVIDEF